MRTKSIIKYSLTHIIIKRHFLFLLLLLPGFAAKGQQVEKLKENPFTYYQGFRNTKNIDSALFFARKLAANPLYINLFTQLMHTEFAQNFIKPDHTSDSSKTAIDTAEMVHDKKLLTKMALDTDEELVRMVKPLYYWMAIANDENDTKADGEITERFIKEYLQPGDVYTNRAGRYALLIFHIIKQHTELKTLSIQLFGTIKERLQENQQVMNVDTASRVLLDKRAWYRYMYAYCNYIQAEDLIKQNKPGGAAIPFQLAFNYSPDLTDNNHYASYYYETVFLTGNKKKRNFQPDYLKYLVKYKTDKNQTLGILLKIALNDPTYKSQLKEFYNADFSQQEDFDTFWLKSINRNLTDAYAFSLKQINGPEFSTAANKGKWILIDFWGTWCIPCRKEHPDLNKFYQSVSSDKSKLVLLTIACKDAEDKVNKYMLENKYIFPVAMADHDIEKTYNIQGYPSKILITPQGKYLVVPFGVDWIAFVKAYCDL